MLGRYNVGMLTSVCVFCGSSPGTKPAYTQAAQRLGALFAQLDIQLIYGGANRGLMGALADACLAGGGKVIGVMPQALVEKEVAHRSLTQLIIVESMHERKAVMAKLAQGFIALPGGFGTWEEFCEVLTWSQLGLQQKACAVLNVDGYYDPLLAMADSAVAEGFVKPAHRQLLLSDNDMISLLERMDSFVMTAVDKWIDRDITP